MSQISIVIPAYNAGRYLDCTVESVRAQTFADWELVIVNDGSTDDTGRLAEEYARLDSRIRVLHQANGGLPAARNAGFARTPSDTPFLIFLDADDVWTPETLATLHAALESQPDAPAAYGLAYYIDESGQRTRPDELEAWQTRRFMVSPRRSHPCAPEAPTCFRVLAFRNAVATAGVILIRRAAYEHAGGFESTPEIKGVEDYALWLRLALLAPLIPVNALLLGYRRHEANMSSNVRMMRSSERAVRCRLASSALVNGTQRRLLERGYRDNERFILKQNLRWASEMARRGSATASLKHLLRAIRCFYHSCRGLCPRKANVSAQPDFRSANPP